MSLNPETGTDVRDTATGVLLEHFDPGQPVEFHLSNVTISPCSCERRGLLGEL